MSEVRNPYAAPDAVVADVAVPGAVPPENKHVKWACMILWGTLAVTLVTLLVALTQPGVLPELGGARSLVTGILGGAFSALIIWWVVAKLSAGRNWMRWLVTIVYGFSAIVSPLTWAASDATDMSFSGPLMSTLTVVSYLLNLATLVLVNTPSAREWFAAMKRSRA